MAMGGGDEGRTPRGAGGMDAALAGRRYRLLV